MSAHCAACGEVGTYVRARFELLVGGGRLILEEVPSVRCHACGRTDPATHARPQLDAVIDITQDLAEETSAPIVHKDFTAMPLEPVDGQA